MALLSCKLLAFVKITWDRCLHHQTELADLPSLDPGLHSIPKSISRLTPTLPLLCLSYLPHQRLQLKVGQCHLCNCPALLQQQDGFVPKGCCTVHQQTNAAVEFVAAWYCNTLGLCMRDSVSANACPRQRMTILIALSLQLMRQVLPGAAVCPAGHACTPR